VTPVTPATPVGAFVASVNAVSVTIQTYAPGSGSGKPQPSVQTVQVVYQAFDANSNPVPVAPMVLTGAAAGAVVAEPSATQLSVAEAQVVSALAAQAQAASQVASPALAAVSKRIAPA
jgi:hypothetical protein